MTRKFIPDLLFAIQWLSHFGIKAICAALARSTTHPVLPLVQALAFRVDTLCEANVLRVQDVHAATVLMMSHLFRAVVEAEGSAQLVQGEACSVH